MKNKPSLKNKTIREKQDYLYQEGNDGTEGVMNVRCWWVYGHSNSNAIMTVSGGMDHQCIQEYQPGDRPTCLEKERI